MNGFLTAEEKNATEAPIAAARGLPPRAYTSQDWARSEREHVFAPTWACLMFADELAPRHAKPIDFLGLPLVAAKSPTGEIAVFHNVCRHRGHKLLSEACDLRGGFVCPYHHWTYGLDGRLRGIPQDNLRAVGTHTCQNHADCTPPDEFRDGIE